MTASRRGLQERLFGSKGVYVPPNPAMLDFLQLEAFRVGAEIQCCQSFVHVANYRPSFPHP